MTAYLSVEEADAYHNLRMSAEIWGALSATEKARRLVNASDYIDSGYIYLGKPSDTHQLRAFPRNGDTDVPVKVKNAVCELALEENLKKDISGEAVAAELDIEENKIIIYDIDTYFDGDEPDELLEIKKEDLIYILDRWIKFLEKPITDENYEEIFEMEDPVVKVLKDGKYVII